MSQVYGYQLSADGSTIVGPDGTKMGKSSGLKGLKRATKRREPPPPAQVVRSTRRKSQAFREDTGADGAAKGKKKLQPGESYSTFSESSSSELDDRDPTLVDLPRQQKEKKQRERPKTQKELALEELERKKQERDSSWFRSWDEGEGELRGGLAAELTFGEEESLTPYEREALKQARRDQKKADRKWWKDTNQSVRQANRDAGQISTDTTKAAVDAPFVAAKVTKTGAAGLLEPYGLDHWVTGKKKKFRE